MEHKAKIMAICNQKGGVGKTVTAVNLGIGLAREGKRVLLIDVDAQGSLTASLGYRQPNQMENTLAAILGRIIMDKPVAPSEGIIHHVEGVDLLPANIELSGLEVALVNTMSRETVLLEYLIRCHPAGLLPVFGDADNQRAGRCGRGFNSHDGSLSFHQGLRTAYPYYIKSERENQSRP